MVVEYNCEDMVKYVLGCNVKIWLLFFKCVYYFFLILIGVRNVEL